jgi:hypothetical protein
MPQVDFTAFIEAQDINYAIAVDVSGRATEEIFKPAGRLALPTGKSSSYAINSCLTCALAILITPRDNVVHYVGNPSKMDAKLLELLGQ